MRKIDLHYQTKDFDFPDILYVGVVAVTNLNGGRYLMCLNRVFGDPALLKQYVLFVVKDLNNSSESIRTLYKGLIIRCRLSSLFPLNKNHWKNKSKFNLDIFQKYRNDINIIKYWKMSEILVTPDGEVDGVTYFSYCLSMVKDTRKQDIDLFIKNSTHVVDIRARNAGLYLLEKPVKIDWLESVDNSLDTKVSPSFIN